MEVPHFHTKPGGSTQHPVFPRKRNPILVRALAGNLQNLQGNRRQVKAIALDESLMVSRIPQETDSGHFDSKARISKQSHVNNGLVPSERVWNIAVKCELI